MQHKRFFRAHRYKFIVGAPIIFMLLLTGTSDNIFRFSKADGVFASVGDGVSVQLEISTKAPVNAVGGTIKFSPDIFSVDAVTRSASIVDLWSEEPTISNTEGTVHFSGGIINANTTTGNRGQIFTINFRALKAGKTTLELEDGELLASNGEGTNILSRSNNLTLYVRPQGQPSPDINDDGAFSIADINTLYLKTFHAYDKKYDINGDSKTDWADVRALIALI